MANVVNCQPVSAKVAQTRDGRLGFMVLPERAGVVLGPAIELQNTAPEQLVVRLELMAVEEGDFYGRLPGFYMSLAVGADEESPRLLIFMEPPYERWADLLTADLDVLVAYNPKLAEALNVPENQQVRVSGELLLDTFPIFEDLVGVLDPWLQEIETAGPKQPEAQAIAAVFRGRRKGTNHV